MIDSSTFLEDDMEAREAMFTKFSHLLRHGLADPHEHNAELKGDSPDTPKGFMKFDSGKPRMSLVDPDFVVGLADILTFGAQKYEAGNWKLLDRKELYRYKDALLRHMYAYLGGELVDKESGRPHLDCAAFNLMALRYFEHGAGSDKGGQE